MAVTDEQFFDAVARMVAQATQPLKVILFGSRAVGTADDASDIDLLVIEKDLQDRAEEYLRLREAVGRVGVGVGLILCTEREFDRRSQVRGSRHHWARKTGRVLYDTGD